MHVAVEVVSGHSAQRVWERIAAFGDIADWHPLIAASRLRAGDDHVAPGCVRELATGDGQTLTERLVVLDASEMHLVYEFVDHPFPVTGYQASMRVIASPEPDHGCLVRWSAEFEPTAGDGRGDQDFFAEKVFAPGLLALEDALSRPLTPTGDATSGGDR